MCACGFVFACVLGCMVVFWWFAYHLTNWHFSQRVLFDHNVYKFWIRKSYLQVYINQSVPWDITYSINLFLMWYLGELMKLILVLYCNGVLIHLSTVSIGFNCEHVLYFNTIKTWHMHLNFPLTSNLKQLISFYLKFDFTRGYIKAMRWWHIHYFEHKKH